jgi:hypothetical protein
MKRYGNKPGEVGGVSFAEAERSQRRFIKWLKKRPGVVEVVIPMRKSQDVPRFLKKLDAFEKRSRKSKFICK